METKSYLLTDQLVDAALKIKKIDVLYPSGKYPFIHRRGLRISYLILFIAIIGVISLFFLDNKEYINYFALVITSLAMSFVFYLMYRDNETLKKQMKKEKIGNLSSFWANSPDLNKRWIDSIRERFIKNGLLKGEDNIDFFCIERYLAEVKALLDDSSFFREAKKEIGAAAILLSLTCVFLTYLFDGAAKSEMGLVFGICAIAGAILYLTISARRLITITFFQDKREKSLRETYTILKLMKGQIMGENDITKFL